MKISTIKQISHQAGLTLIELTVVLLVLVGLAGLTVPYISGFMANTSSATGAFTVSDLNNSLQLYQNQTNALPNNLDLLALASGSPSSAVDTTIDSYVMMYPGSQPMNWTTASTNLTTNTNISNSLIKAGITSVVQSPNTGVVYTANGDGTYTATQGVGGPTVDVTFNPAWSNSTNQVAVSSVTNWVTSWDGMFTDYCAGPNVIVNCGMTSGTYTQTGGGMMANLNNSQGYTIANILGYTVPTGHQIIVLGVGQSNSAIGKTIASSPVVFAINGGAGGTSLPQLVYSRYFAAIDVDAANGTSAAKMIGIIYGDGSMQLEGISTTITNYYKGSVATQNML